jgi:dTDP-4-dehydrorhamnose reductase
MRVLITGSSGRLGLKLVELCRKRFETIPTFATKKLFEDALRMDICLIGEVRGVLSDVKPDVIVHAAAMTNVDACEVDKQAAWLTNAIGTRNLAREAKRIGCKLCYVSTDYVFDGERGLYKETDEPNPINYYGKTKLEGERFVSRICNDYLIVRSSVLYGAHPTRPSFATWLIDELSKGRQVSIAIDLFNSPTLTDNLAEMILALIEANQRGVFHAAGKERMSRYEFALRIAKEFGLDQDLIIPVKSSQLSWRARRPKDSSLDVLKISTLARPLSINQSLKLLKRAFRNNPGLSVSP